MLADIVYYTSLLVCIYLGGFYKNIDDIDTKRNCGTGLGVLITYLICGSQMIHSVLMVWGNILIIKCCDKHYIHQLSLSYTWTYLVYLSYNIKTEGAPYQLWIHQAIALRLVGLAFEIYFVEKSKQVNIKGQQLLNAKLNLGDPQNVPHEPSTVDIIAYAYYFIGLHKGPYYRWKVFEDHLTAPFGLLGNFRLITEQKLTKVIACTTIYLILRIYFSPKMYYMDSFYNTYGTDNRYLYNIPQLVMYVLQYQVLMMLCTSVCTESGFGIYPAKCLSLPGYGPSTNMNILNLALTENNDNLQYNFATLRSFDNEKIILGPRMRDTIQGWDMTRRYWFWAYTFKTINKSDKKIKSAISFLEWSLWCGLSLQQLIISITLWVHIHLETEYSKLYETDSMKMPWDIGFSIMRLFCFAYLTPCLIIQDTATVFKYYNSIYWSYHLILIMLLCDVLYVQKSKATCVFLRLTAN